MKYFVSKLQEKKKVNIDCNSDRETSKFLWRNSTFHVLHSIYDILLFIWNLHNSLVLITNIEILQKLIILEQFYEIRNILDIRHVRDCRCFLIISPIFKVLSKQQIHIWHDLHGWLVITVPIIYTYFGSMRHLGLVGTWRSPILEIFIFTDSMGIFRVF